MVDVATPALSAGQLVDFERDGYLILRGFFDPGDVQALAETFAALHARGEVPGCFKAVPPEQASDPLEAYPRMMHPHRVSEVARRYLLHPRLEPVLGALLREEPIAAQSMFYWKPPGARGQALHQDNFYLRAYPGTCLAAWLAIDSADRQNGGLFVAPGSHKLDVFCPEEADLSVSFTRHLVPVPEGLEQVPADLAAGDVLFFGGSVIHGSEPNRSRDHFRRSFICHYVGASAEEVGKHYRPLYRFDGSAVEVADATGAGPCGEFEAKGPH